MTDQVQEPSHQSHGKGRRNLNAAQLKNQRITRRMKKIITKNVHFSQSEEEEKCAICLAQCATRSATLPCSHSFCLSCIANWWVTNSTCPYCRHHFSYISDCKGRRLTKQDMPQDIMIKRQQTLKCQSCWADIQNDPMRICYECRCVYMHKRCMLTEQLKQIRWRCQECLENQEQQIERTEQMRQQEGGNYRCHYKINNSQLNHRHSQRLMISQANERFK